MISTTWIETVISPKLTLEPFTPVELVKPLRFGPRGDDPDYEWPESHQLVVSPAPGGVIFADGQSGFVGGREFRTIPTLLKPGGVWSKLPLTARVLSSPDDSAGWPSSVPKPAAPWTDQTLSVLADQLLEVGRSVGQRFLTRDATADANWLPAFAGMNLREASTTWRRGVAESMTVAPTAGWEFGRALASLAVCVPLRRLVLRCNLTIDPIGLMKGLIAGGGLPCLETLRLDVGPPSTTRPADLAVLPGFGAAFPSLGTVDVQLIVPSPFPFPVVG